MNCLIHVGLHHTATTSFQNFLNDNEKFLSEIGIIYPKSIINKNSKQHSLIPGCLIPNHHTLQKNELLDVNNLLKRLNEEIKGSDSELCIISSEVFDELIDIRKKDLKSILVKISELFIKTKLLITTKKPIYRALSMHKAQMRQSHIVPEFKLELFKAPSRYKNKILGSKNAISKWKSLGIDIIVKDIDETENAIENYFSTSKSLLPRKNKWINLINI